MQLIFFRLQIALFIPKHAHCWLFLNQSIPGQAGIKAIYSYIKKFWTACCTVHVQTIVVITSLNSLRDVIFGGKPLLGPRPRLQSATQFFQIEKKKITKISLKSWKKESNEQQKKNFKNFNLGEKIFLKLFQFYLPSIQRHLWVLHQICRNG